MLTKLLAKASVCEPWKRQAHAAIWAEIFGPETGADLDRQPC